MKLTNQADYKNRIESIIQDGNNVLTFRIGNDNDLYVVMDYYSKEDEKDTDEEKEKKVIQYGEEFTLSIVVPKSGYPDLYGLLVELFENIKADRIKHGAKVINTVTVYSHETESEVANYLEIIRDDEQIELSFNTQEQKPGYRSDYNSSVYIPIRLYRTWSDSNMFEEFFKKLPNVINLENDQNEERSVDGTVPGSVNRSLSYHCKNGKKYKGNK